MGVLAGGGDAPREKMESNDGGALTYPKNKNIYSGGGTDGVLGTPPQGARGVGLKLPVVSRDKLNVWTQCVGHGNPVCTPASERTRVFTSCEHCGRCPWGHEQSLSGPVGTRVRNGCVSCDKQKQKMIRSVTGGRAKKERDQGRKSTEMGPSSPP